ncbi:aminoglycoside phosphotransferase family protein [Paracerasibacillus soli]|uniref:Aminoglycoside phosphotransferase family protein n=1 Tax=Paracerasibacillus soli TaxID=480284 RepID=A0ABU5CNR4_9BACI|nr:aminoglycoside phosphotransferase family protein [Virgibacillus soli]MDY0407985.1 aminoglycoside phosphotransferase family protein [Virgibacillus soli]
MHQYKDPNVNLDWYSHKKEKTKRYFQELEQLKIDKKLKTLCLDYFIKNESLMKRRPTTFQHDDFHPANIIIENGKFAGIIDFQRMDWGDPIHDLHKLGFFSSPISIPFTQGIVDGYHLHTKLSTDFWELYTLYSVIHLVSSLVWGTKRGMQEKMMMYAMNVLKDHDNFTRIIPRWYQT